MRTSVRRATLALALTPLVSVPLGTVAWAATSSSTTTITSTPAPPGDASAVAASVAGIVDIGSTSAHAGSDGAKAHATALAIGGQDVFGGESTNGTKNGELIGTGDTPLGDAELAPWTASASKSDNSSEAAAEAALAHVDIASAVEIWLLHSTSAAKWSGDKSTGDSRSDGGEVNLGGGALDVLILHSEAHSGSKGKSDLVVINGNEIGSSDQVNGQCEIPADPLLHLICLTANGGSAANGVTTSGGQVAGATILGGQAPDVTVSKVDTKAGSTPKVSTVEGKKITQHGPLPHTSGPAASGQLPFTGSDAGRLAAIGAALAAIGASLTAMARRRRFLAI